jgi:hypothetical protein
VVTSTGDQLVAVIAVVFLIPFREVPEFLASAHTLLYWLLPPRNDVVGLDVVEPAVFWCKIGLRGRSLANFSRHWS